MSGCPSDTDQINGQTGTKTGQSAGRFFHKRFTYLRHISSILRHVRDVISRRHPPSVASVTRGVRGYRKQGGKPNGRPPDLMKFSRRFPQVVTCGQSLLRTYCTRRHPQILPGWKCFNKRIPGRGRAVMLPRLPVSLDHLINVYCLRILRYCVYWWRRSFYVLCYLWTLSRKLDGKFWLPTINSSSHADFIKWNDFIKMIITDKGIFSFRLWMKSMKYIVVDKLY